MLQARARAFDFQPTRSGTLIKFSTTVHCSRCPETRYFEAIRKLPDEAVLKRFHQWGWLMGRSRSYDICPRCLGASPENRLADKFPVTKAGRAVPNSAEVVDIAKADLEQSKTRVIAAIDKHLPPKRPILGIGGPTAQPKSAAHRSSVEEPARDEHEMSPSDLMERVLAELQAIRESQRTIAGEVENIRAAHELILDDNSSIHEEHAEIVRKLDSLAGHAAVRTEGIAKAIETLAGTVGATKDMKDAFTRQDSAAQVTEDIKQPTQAHVKLVDSLFDQPPAPIELTAIEPALSRLRAVEKKATTRKPRASRKKDEPVPAMLTEAAGRPRKRRQSLNG